MALTTAGSLVNIYAAWDTYLTAQLVTAGGLAVRLHGVRRFIPPVDDPWIEAHYQFLGMQGQYQRQVGPELYGTERHGFLQLSLFQRARVYTTRYTIATARDRVVTAFPEGGIVPVYDDASADTQGVAPQVAVIILDGLTEQSTDDGKYSGVMQHVMTVMTRYLEEYTRA